VLAKEVQVPVKPAEDGKVEISICAEKGILTSKTNEEPVESSRSGVNNSNDGPDVRQVEEVTSPSPQSGLNPVHTSLETPRIVQSQNAGTSPGGRMFPARSRETPLYSKKCHKRRSE
jgi:hypothetical protein